MGITTILNNGVLGLTAQSRSLGSISDNIANASTTGYKATETQFGDLVLGDRSTAAYADQGVRAFNRLDTSAGTVTQTGITTNASIVGNGFFIVQDVDFMASATQKTPPVELTRAGDFSLDKDGQMVNGAGKALMGFKLDPNNPTASPTSTADLTPVSLASVKNYHEATTQASVALNLPSDQKVATTPTPANTTGIDLKLIDKTGAGGSANLRFMKSGQNADGSTTWQVYSAGAVGSDGKAVGDIKANDPSTWQTLGSLTFDRSGVLTGGADGSKVTVSLNPGGNFAPVTVDLGTIGSPDDSMTNIAGMDIGNRQSQNGIPAGSYQSAELTENGYLKATFAGGRERFVYRIPDAVVANPQDLESVSGTAFRPTVESGNIKLANFGVSTGTGTKTGSKKGVGATLNSGSVEGSNVNIEEQFTTLIQAQRTYSAASKLVSTADEMTQTTLTLRA
ncbi:flagellar hook protein FlgE [Azospirillum sp. sgz302134]